MAKNTIAISKDSSVQEGQERPFDPEVVGLLHGKGRGLVHLGQRSFEAG
jgi:hypothetical protein